MRPWALGVEERGVLEDSTVIFRLWGCSDTVVAVTTPGTAGAGVHVQRLKTELLGNRDIWELQGIRPWAPTVARRRA